MGSCEYGIITKSYYLSGLEMVVVAQLVRAPDCGSGGRRFETDLPPHNNKGLQKCSPFFRKNLPTNLPLKFIQILQNAKKCI